MSKRIDLDEHMRGDVWTFSATFTEASVPVDITGWDFWITFKLNPEAPDSEATAQIAVTASGATALEGKVWLTVAPEVSSQFLPTTYSYDIQYSEGPGHVRTLSYGRVKVIADITRNS